MTSGPPASELPAVCLIGAGASGITTARSLSARGIPFDCFDKGDRVGGIWVMDSASGLSSAYRDLHINVSRERMEFSDLPVPRRFPVFPHHAQIAQYFADYVEHFGLDRHIHLNTSVERAVRTEDGIWEVELDTGERRRYDALVVANGHHSDPRWPEPAPPGTFAGRQMHSHDYRDDSVLRDRDVVVVGLGNSAMDIAVESSYAASRTYLSTRRGAHILPKMMFGFPYDQVPGLEFMLGRGIGRGRLSLQLPWRVRQALLAFGHRMAVGRMSDYGLPDPDHSFGAIHPTISTRLLDRLTHGRIEPKPAVAGFDGHRVAFADGSEVTADLVVWCTGYNITFPFLDPEMVPVADNRVELYWNVFPPEVPDLAFVGLLQPGAGSTMQIAEGQGRWVAAHLAGEYALPPADAMRRAMAKERRRAAKRYVPTARHTVQLHQFEYLWRLRDELRRGRARRRGGAPAVPARAAQTVARESIRSAA
jgi:dimethylaniline monooxygenase (N-oxide forming)